MQPGSLAGALPHEQARIRRDWALFAALTFLFSFGFAVYAGVFQNFLKDELHATLASQLGRLESIREIPGLLAALMGGTVVALAETRIAGLGLVIASIGIGFSGLMPNFATLIAITVFWSVGFHLWSSVSPSITLAIVQGREGGRHLGQIRAIGSTATLAGLGIAWLLDRAMRAARLPLSAIYHTSFAIAGTAILIAALLCMGLSPHAASREKRAPIIVRRQYGLYYLLTFLDGCRRQIFSIFATFALILVYHVPLGPMLLLQFINASMITLAAPRVGRMIDRKGERGPLTFYSIGLIVVFLGYATSRTLVLWLGYPARDTVFGLYALYLIDNVLFSFGVGFTTYLHRIVRKNELTPCLAMGTTMNHIAAVTVPVGGAWLWDHFHSYQVPFWVGVAIAFVSLIATRWLPREAPGTASHVVPPETPPQEEERAWVEGS